MRWRLATALVLSGATLNGCSCEPPNPSLHVSPGTSVEVGQTLTFDSNAQGDDPPDHVLTDSDVDWDLDGNGSFGERPGERVVQRSFAAPGTYSVTFHVRTDYTENFLSGDFPVDGYATTAVTVTAPQPPGENQVPSASFEFSPNPAITEYAGTYDASGSKDPDGQIVKYEWEWGDGTPGTTTTSPSAKHAFASSGAYSVRLTVTDDQGATGVTERTVQVQDGPPPGKLVAREAAGVSAARAGSPFTLAVGKVRLTPGITTVAGSKLLTAGIRARGRLHFRRAPRLLGTHASPRWAGSLAFFQKGSGLGAKLSAQGYVLLVFSRKDRVCLAGTASAKLSGAGFAGRLAVAGGRGLGARLRGSGTFSPATRRNGNRVLNGRLKLRKARKARRLPKACRSLARILR